MHTAKANFSQVSIIFLDPMCFPGATWGLSRGFFGFFLIHTITKSPTRPKEAPRKPGKEIGFTNFILESL